MSDFRNTKTVKARKPHSCDGLSQIVDYLNNCNLTAKEAIGRIEPHHIKKGEEHTVQSGVHEGDFFSWRSCKPCEETIKKHNLYYED